MACKHESITIIAGESTADIQDDGYVLVMAKCRCYICGTEWAVFGKGLPIIQTIENPA
jgi:hypothetical protein